MKDKLVGDKELKEAVLTIYQWFLQQNAEQPKKPITMLDNEITHGGETFRLITHWSFYGRNELPVIKGDNDD